MKEYLKKKKSEENFYSTPTSILSSKTFTSDQKVVLVVMMADLEMNGSVKWCQNTYADKTGKSRKFINAFISTCVDKGLVKPSEDNKVGSRNNHYIFNIRMFELLLKANNPSKFTTKRKKAVTPEDKAVTPEDKAVTPEDTTCNPGGPNLLPGVTHIENTDSIENTYLYREEEDDDVRTSSPSSRDEETLEDFLTELETIDV